MVPIDDIAHIDVTVLLEVRIKSEAEHSIIAPGSDFVTDVQQRYPRIHSVLQNPNPSGAFPNVSAIGSLGVRIESQPDRCGPKTSNFFLGKTGGQGGRAEARGGRADERRECAKPDDRTPDNR